MLLFLDQLPAAHHKADVCIVGAGPAGITLAMELVAQGMQVVLCEAGGLEFSSESQECYEGETVGDEYFDLDGARLRFLGGTSNHWTGVCADLAEEDLAPKPFAPQTGWPIDMEEFRPYINRARKILKLAPAEAPKPILDGRFARIDIQRTNHLRFKDIYLETLIASQNITTILHANLIGLEQDGQRVTKLLFQSYSDRKITVEARHFVIACGGIENARLMLHLNEEYGAELGEASGALGRWFTEHPHGEVGEYVFFNPEGFNLPGFDMNFSVWDVHVAPTARFIAEGRSLNMRLKFTHYRHDTSRQVIEDLLCVAPGLAERFTKATCAGSVGMVLEQAPLSENRLELGAERDRFGIRRPVLYWRWSDQDRQTIREVAITFAKEMAEADVGRMSISDWVLDSNLEVIHNEHVAAFHHIGMTRMADAEEDGVVDTNCKVFGTSNLFVAGSSVFPSAGHANPTAPIMALSLRLADHLASLQI